MEPFNPKKAWDMVEKIKSLLYDLTDYLSRYIDPIEGYDMDREYYEIVDEIVDKVNGWVKLAEAVSRRSGRVKS